ncbi:hypothetical protein B0J15DRAFT_513588 [Fusarium solani]|uniref:Uncharacterized protein n=1 Tax=Fusarium solani TaxID=169388 RepID=A0A9P9HA81_FUSSL|nr:uncharacterized protein B0J15DRAFT_513588 [Fusarium solani]KAH7253367.1 hypothetical protein B0J15DRAFT_513588 [Fusarium solani]
MGSIPQDGTAAPSTEAPTFGQGTRVAVIGSGVSGICAGAHLLRQGANVVVFERSGVSSGVWNFDPRTDSNSVVYPSKPASLGDYATSVPGQFLPQQLSKQHHPLNTSDGDALEVAFAPPGPAYSGLKNNVPTSLLYSNLKPWPKGTPENVSHWEIAKYLQNLSTENGLDEVTLYNTRVESATKSLDGSTWIVRTITLLAKDGTPRVVERSWDFDAIIVCSGHYNLPRVPDIPGLSQWKELFKDRISHTKEYRNPNRFRDKNVLVIGGGTSSLDVCRELSDVTTGVYQSTRGGQFDHPTEVLPEIVKRVGGVTGFTLDSNAIPKGGLEEQSPIPGQIVLKDGQTLRDIHHVIVATGYLTSFPFLPQYHNDNVSPDDATPEVLVTSEANMVHNLHRDIFYIEDPSLSFVGIPYYVSTFSVFDFQAQAIARVLTGKTRLPSKQALRDAYNKRISLRGRGRNFHSLAEEGAELAYIKDLVDSVNGAATGSDVEPMQGHTEEWLATHRAYKERRNLFRQGKIKTLIPLDEFLQLKF